MSRKIRIRSLSSPRRVSLTCVTLARTKAQEAQLTQEEHKLVEPFSPLFVYPIYGEEETIFGFKGLDIDVRFFSSVSFSRGSC